MTRASTGRKQGREAEPAPFVDVDSGFPPGSVEDMKLRFTRRVIFLARRWRNRINEAMRDAGQSHARWSTLTWVSILDGKANHRELSERVGVELPTLIRLLNRLEEEGLVARAAHESQARAKSVTLTPGGRAVLAEMTRITREVRAEFLEGVDPNKLAVAMELLDGVLAGAEGRPAQD
jgi:MarR family transcriptional regulator, transcriptional regulator for hemolysin